ncbi:hypothetical protein M0R72_12650 [Candidatus Pacearchaeota archaeon]|jgi:hypothetical protein|nr:hypothetical protein [Candidatus Pacearchaeota archaeon]
MAGDWVKWCIGLAKKPEIIRAAHDAGMTRHEVASRFMVFCEWADENIPEESISADGPTYVSLSPDDGDNRAFVSELLGSDKLADSFAANWIKYRNGRLELPNFSRHNGETSKTRARNSKNQKKKRRREKSDVDGDQSKPVTDLSPPRGDILVTRGEESRDKKKERKKDAAAPLSISSFDVWWKAYPKKSGKEAARKAYAAALKRLGMSGNKRADAEAMLLEAVRAYAASPKANSAFCWNPATWLNQGHWEDDPAVWQRGDDAPKESPSAYQQSTIPLATELDP